MATTTKTSPKVKTQAETRVAEKLSLRKAKSKFWRNSAPKGVDGDDSWTVWSRHLAKRNNAPALQQLCESSSTPLRWGLNVAELSPRTIEMLEWLDRLSDQPAKSKRSVSAKSTEPLLSSWLEGSRVLPLSIDFALECLVVAHALPRISDQVPADFWWSLVDGLWQVVNSAGDWRCDEELPPDEGLAQQMLAGELPLTLAHFLAEMRPVYKRRAAARDALSEGIAELTNGNGQVQGEYLGHLRPLLACWTRCRLIGSQTKKSCWNRKSDEQYQWMITHALGLSSATGVALLAEPHGEVWTADFLRTAIAAGGDQADVAAAKSIYSKKLTAKLKAKASEPVPDTSDNCEWAGVAYMRTDWDRKHPVLAIDYSSPDLKLECWLGTQRLISGTWTWETTLNGKRIEPVGTWDESCWFSDDDVDYLELSMELAGGARLDRQICLARDEMFLLLTDYVLETRGGKLSHRYRLPLDGEIEFEPERDTREGLLTAGKTLARVLPLALPEWRSDPRVGQLTANNHRLQLEQEREGQSLACPLLIDLDRSRAKKPCTWRQLTVAQSLEVQTPDVAVGYRAQCGKDQWLVYRSMTEPANRTLLGQNLSNECLVARFLPESGEVDELLEIE